MKKKIYRFLFLIPLLLSVFLLTGCKVMMPSDYIKIKRIIIEDCNKVGLHGKVTITDLYWTALEIPTYHVSYTYSEETYDGQTIKLEENKREFMKTAHLILMKVLNFYTIRNLFWSRNLSKKLRRKLKNN